MKTARGYCAFMCMAERLADNDKWLRITSAARRLLTYGRLFVTSLPEVFALLSCPNNFLPRQCLLEGSSSRTSFAEYVFVVLGLDQS